MMRTTEERAFRTGASYTSQVRVPANMRERYQRDHPQYNPFRSPGSGLFLSLEHPGAAGRLLITGFLREASCPRDQNGICSSAK